MLAISVREAIRDAVGGLRPRRLPSSPSPARPRPSGSSSRSRRHAPCAQRAPVTRASSSFERRSFTRRPTRSATTRALVCHEDGGLLDPRRSHRRERRLSRRCAPGVSGCRRRSTGAADSCCPASSTRTCTIPQLRIIGGLGRTLLDWLEHVALPEEARMADVAYATGTAQRVSSSALAAHGTTTALVFGAHFAPATAALFEAAGAAGLRIISGLVVSDRCLRPELHQSPARRLSRQHRTDSALSPASGRLLYAVTPRFALSASEADARGVPDAARRARRAARPDPHQRERRTRLRKCARLFPWAADYLAVYERYRPDRRAHRDGAQRAPDRRGARAACGRPDVDRALSVQQRGARQRHLSPAPSRGRRRARARSAPTSAAAPGSGCSRKACRRYLMQRVAAGRDEPRSGASAAIWRPGPAPKRVGLDDEIGDFRPGKAADLVYIRPPADSSAGRRAVARAKPGASRWPPSSRSPVAESVREVRVAGQPVHRAGEPMQGRLLAR